MQGLDLRSNLKTILREKSMSQLELARQLNISPTNLNTRLARGRNCQLSLVESICNALSIQVGELMYGDHPQIDDNVEKEDDSMYRIKYEKAQTKIIELLEENALLKANNQLKKAPLNKKAVGE